MNDNQRALLFMVEQHINAARLGDSASILMLSMLVPGSKGKADDEVIAAAESWWSELRNSTKDRPQSEQTNFGYIPNRAGTKALVASLPIREIGLSVAEKKDTFLWVPLRKKKPSWRRGAQGIGDCVSFGWELCCTMALAIQDRLGTSEWVEEAATESIYGGSRVEADGGRLGGYSDGSYGGAAAKFLREWGCVLRLDYSKETGIESHDLRKYSSDKAKSWGNFGCGGEEDAGREDGKLDKIARRYPVEIAPIRNTDEAAAAIQNGYPIAVCSGVGYGRMKRNSDGICEASGRWAHCMMLGGVRWRGGKPDFRQFQSWGDSCSGPDPGIDDGAISACSWWTTERDAQRQLDEDDSFAVSFVGGFPPQRIDWADVASTWK